jgi:hypothetical protein
MEEIRAGARVCPHCHSPQSPQRWQGIGTFLKWVGGVTAIISLVLGLWQANKVFEDWSDRRASMDQFLKAADFQLDLMDYPGSWEIVQECLALDPMSPKAIKKQLQVAMAWTRDPMRHKGQKKYSEVVSPLMSALYLGAVLEDEQLAADALAHIGFANFLKSIDSDEVYKIDEYFKNSIEKNPRNIYGHVFWGYWILNRVNKKDYGRDKLEMAMEHLGIARNSAQSAKERELVCKFALTALGNTYVKGADVETIKWANEMRVGSLNLDPSARYGIKEIFSDMCRTQYDKGEILAKLLVNMSPEEIRETYLWVSKGEARDRGIEAESYAFLSALFAETAGNLNDSFRQYTSLAQEVKDTASTFKLYVRKALNRLVDKADQKGGLQKTTENAFEKAAIVLGDQARFGIRVDSYGLVANVGSGPAGEAGMKSGEIILRIDEQRFDERGVSPLNVLSTITDAIISGKREESLMITLRGQKIVFYSIRR